MQRISRKPIRDAGAYGVAEFGSRSPRLGAAITPVCSLHQAVGVSDDEISRIELNHLGLVHDFGKESGRGCGGFEPSNSAVTTDHHGGIMACIYIVQCSHIFVEDAVE